MLVTETCRDDYVELERRVGALRVRDGPVGSSHSSTSISSTSIISSPRISSHGGHTPSEAGPSSGVRQSSRNSYVEVEGEDEAVAPQVPTVPEYYDGRYYIVAVGRSPGIYRQL